MLSRAAIEMCQRLQFAPHVFHCNDWHTSLIPLYLRTIYAWDTLFASTRSALTIHNIGYQGMFSSDVLPDLDFHGADHHLHQGDLQHGVINFLKTGILYANLVTTVSPTYAREMQTPEYGMGLDGLLRARSETVVGILNGVDYDEWNPESDTLIPANYSASNLDGKLVCKTQLMQEMGLQGGADTPLAGIVTRLVGQ
jgi:starch synthase